MPVSAMAASYPHGTWIAPHRHRRAQLLYTIEGVMHVQSDGASWIVPPTRGVWLEAGLDHTVQMSGSVEMRTVFVEPGAVEHLPGRSCVVEVHPLLRELILAAVDVPLDYAPGSRHDHLMRLLLAEVTAAPLLPLYLPWPHDTRLRTICDALVAAPDDLRTVAEWADIAGISVRTLHRGFQRETGARLPPLARAGAAAARAQAARAWREGAHGRDGPRLQQPERILRDVQAPFRRAAVGVLRVGRATRSRGGAISPRARR